MNGDTMFRQFLTSLLLLTLCYVAFAGTITKTYYFEQPVVESKAGLTTISVRDCQIAGETGQPALPALGIKLLLPPGEEINSVEISAGNSIILGYNYQIDPIPTPVIISKAGPYPPTLPDPAVYNSNELFPEFQIQGERTEFMRGYSIGYMRLYPAQYRPQTGELSYFPQITVTVHTSPSAKAQTALSQFYRASMTDRQYIAFKVENTAETSAYGDIDSDETDEPDYPFLLITTQDLLPSFQPWIDFKEQYGYPVGVVMVDEIYNTYPGSDHPMKIRNCIIDYYQHYNTSFVLLGGDDELIPHRGLYASLAGETDADIPGDIYYAGLDGTWNNDGDQNWGEANENDLTAEVVVGRAAVDSPTETVNFVHKQLMYQTQPVINEIETALMVGEDLGWVTWGSDLKDEIRLGTNYNPPIPNNFTVGTLYDTPSWSFSAMSDLLPLLNHGPNLVNHMGHANTDYMMKYNAGQVSDNNMTNNGVNHNYYIVYSQGCYCGSFDNRTTGGGYISDCITEKFSTIANGAVSMVTNSRYGWGNNTGTNGPSQFFDRQFFDAIFRENFTRIGETNQDSKEDNIPYLGSATLWVYYELNLFGDPGLDIWTAEPQLLSPVCQPTIILGSSEYSVEIPGLENAYCVITNGSGIIGSSMTNSAGIAIIQFDDPIATLENLTLSISAHNYIPYSQTVSVISPNMPYMIVEEVEIHDINGDNDGILDLGETSYLSLSFQNVGLYEAQNVTADISIADECVTLLNSTVSIGNVAPQTLVQLTDVFELSIACDVPDQHCFTGLVTMRDALDSVWTQNLAFTITAPAAGIYSAEVIDPDNRLNPGDTADLEIALLNAGSGEIHEALVEIYCDNPYIVINNAFASSPLIISGGNAPLTPYFNLTVSDNCPDNSIVPVYMEITDEFGYSVNLLFEMTIGGFFDSFENGQGEWTHESLSSGYADNWLITNYRNYTLNGANSFHCGSASGGAYQNNTDAGLTTPVFDMSQNTILSFWHWCAAETSAMYPGECYDGGFVEMGYQGSIFFPITPDGGYTHTIRNASTPGPYTTGTPVFSGVFDWRQETFNLSLYPAGQVQFRFRFGADNAVVKEGWYVDDVEITFAADELPPSNFQASINESLVHLTWNSPNVPPPALIGKTGQRDSESLNSYNIYRNNQLLAENVVSLEFYDDLSALSYGEYEYQVSAAYSSGEEQFSAIIPIQYPSSGVNPNSSTVPAEFFIDDNYPNPFNPETNFRFGLPVGSKVQLTIFSIQGREIAKLVDEWKPAGYYNVVWSAKHNPSGIYFYRLHTSGLEKSGKLLLLK